MDRGWEVGGWARLGVLGDPVVWRPKTRLQSKPPSAHEEAGSEKESYMSKSIHPIKSF